MILSQREFSERKHLQKQWNSTSFFVHTCFLKYCITFLSFKRKEVHKLAQDCLNQAWAIDVGSGNGTYARWFITSGFKGKILAVDWSYTALRSHIYSTDPAITPICADITALPFKSQTVGVIFSIDTLGHCENLESILSELVRIGTDSALYFLHSEVNNYRTYWPDRWLCKKNMGDIIASLDGHYCIKSCEELRELYATYFSILYFYSPPGFLGWLFGYPEKYAKAFKTAGSVVWVHVLNVLGYMKQCIIFKILFKCIAIGSNYIELRCGLYGGGSSFARLKKK